MDRNKAQEIMCNNSNAIDFSDKLIYNMFSKENEVTDSSLIFSI